MTAVYSLSKDLRADEAKALREHLRDCLALRRKLARDVRAQHDVYCRRVIKVLRGLEASL